MENWDRPEYKDWGAKWGAILKSWNHNSASLHEKLIQVLKDDWPVGEVVVNECAMLAYRRQHGLPPSEARLKRPLRPQQIAAL